MAIKKSAADIPRAASEGNPPDATPRFGQLLAEAWAELDATRFHEKSRTDVPRYIRLGWAGQCARLIGYRLLDVEPTNPPDLAAEWRMGLGTMVHELLQDAVRKAFPGAEVEKIVGAESDEAFGFPVSGRSDLFLVTEGETVGDMVMAPRRTVVEIKTINGFGFKMAVGARGAPEGPRTGAIFQAALNARAHHADEVVVLYLSLECLSDRELTSLVTKQGGEPHSWRKMVAEWSWDMAELDDMVDRELQRLGKIVKMVDTLADDFARDAVTDKLPFIEWLEKVAPGSKAAVLPPRSVPLEMPARARITDPARKGAWSLVIDDNVMQAGEYWGCAYCSHLDRCTADGPS